jgi:hypothetical protein
VEASLVVESQVGFAPDTPRNYAPRTRGGVLISCTGFATLAASASVPALEDAIGPVMGLGFVVAVLTTAWVPRLIRPGRSWLRSVLPSRTCTIAYVAAAGLALVAVETHTTVAGFLVAAAILVGGTLVTALTRTDRAG